MNREQYMIRLERYLKRLPKEEYDNAIEYFNEYFDEAGEDKEKEVIEELGSPGKAASELMANLIDQKVVESCKKPSSAWKILAIAIVGLMAAPVGLPIVLLILAGIVTVIALIGSAILGAGVLVVVGLYTIFGLGINVIGVSSAATLVVIGAGFMAAGLGILIVIFLIYILTAIIRSIAVAIGRKAGRKER